MEHLKNEPTPRGNMSNPDNLKYHVSHTWLKMESDGICIIGVTQHAQDQLGDVVYVQPPG